MRKSTGRLQTFTNEVKKVITPRQRIVLTAQNGALRKADDAKGFGTAAAILQKQISSQSPRARKGLTQFQELELKSHLCLVIAAKIEETDDI